MSSSCQIGFDVGGTTLKASLVKETQILATVSAETPVNASQPEAVAVMASLINSLKQSAQEQSVRVTGVGMGIAALVNYQTGDVITAPNLPTWKDFPLARQLSEQVALPVKLDNDVRAMAMGELAHGAARGCQHALCLTVGTGVGSAIIIRGQIHRGASLTAGEFGHIMLVPQGGRLCGCGNRGCLETLAGTDGILSLAQRYLERDLAPVLAQKISSGQKLTPRLISEAALDGDQGCVSIWNEIGTWLGIALSGAVNFLNPERLVIGGGIAQAGDLLFNPIRHAIRLHAFERPASVVQVVPAALGAQAGMIGAAVLAQEGLV